MFLRRVVLAAVLYSFGASGLAYAKPAAIITGTVTDSRTLKPVAGARVFLQMGNSMQQGSVQANGQYRISVPSSSMPRSAVIAASALGYAQGSKFLLVMPGSSTTVANLALRDPVKPALSITSPLDNALIFANPTIELTYDDLGSGIDIGSVRILVGSDDVSRYIIRKTSRNATCVIPKAASLSLGAYGIQAKVKDRAGNLAAQTVYVTVVDKAGHYVWLGKKALLNKDSLSTYHYFKMALDAGPDNPEAHFYFALMRLAFLPQQDEVFALLRDMGFTGPQGAALTRAHLDPFNLRLATPAGFANLTPVASFPGGQRVQWVLGKSVIPEIDKAVKDLEAALKNKNFVTFLDTTNPFTGSQRIKIDYGDVSVLKSLLLACKSKMSEMLVRDLGVDVVEESLRYAKGELTPEYVLAKYPDLMRVNNIPLSLQARDALVSAIDSYLGGYAFISARSGDQSDNLLSISAAAQYRTQAAAFAGQLQDIRKALVGRPDKAFSAKLSQLVDAQGYYARPFDFRRLLDHDAADYLFMGTAMPYLEYVSRNVSRVEPAYQELLPPENGFYKKTRKEADYADIVGAQATAESLRVALLSLCAYDLDLDVQRIVLDVMHGKQARVQEVLAAYPHLLYLNDRRLIEEAGRALARMDQEYRKASEYLLYYEDANPADDLFVAPQSFKENAGRYGAMISKLTALQETLVDPDFGKAGDEFRVNPAEFFLRYKDVRLLMPGFDSDNKAIPGTWPDETFGGILPDHTF